MEFYGNNMEERDIMSGIWQNFYFARNSIMKAP